MTPPLVNIVVVTFNAAAFIRRTLESCLEQTYPNCHVTVFDNASTDGTVEILKTFEERVRVHYSSENIGPYRALNRLLDLSRAAYVAIQDHDDVWFPNKIEQQVAFMETSPDVVACGCQVFYYHESEELLILDARPYETDFVDHSTLLFRAGPERYDETRRYPDLHFERELLSRRGAIRCLPAALVVHRIRRDGMNLSRHGSRVGLANLRAAVREFGLHNVRGIVSTLGLIDRLPRRLGWAVRRRVTQRKALWLTRPQFEARYGAAILGAAGPEA